MCILGDSVASPDGGKALRVHRVPIVNAAGQVTQIVSQSAVLQYLELVRSAWNGFVGVLSRERLRSRNVVCTASVGLHSTMTSLELS